MKLLKRILKGFVVVLIIFIYTVLCSNTSSYAQNINEIQNPIKIGVLLYRFDDAYISLVRQNLEEIQKANEGRVQFSFYDGRNDQKVQNQTINMLLQSKSADLILLNLVDVKTAYQVIDRIKEYNIPVVLFNREPLTMDAVQSYGKAFFVGTNSAQAGALEGKIIVDKWNENKTAMDINKDDILQYVMLKGESENKDAIERTQYSILEINDAGIQTEQLALTVCDWNRELAKENFEPLFLRYGNKIEAIISNNDEMAIGAIEILKKYGYNAEDPSKTITVVGVDAIPAAQELISRGEMTGSVVQDAKAMAEASYTIGMNLVNNKKPLEGTTYEADDTGVAIRLSYKEYMNK